MQILGIVLYVNKSELGIIGAVYIEGTMRLMLVYCALVRKLRYSKIRRGDNISNNISPSIRSYTI